MLFSTDGKIVFDGVSSLYFYNEWFPYNKRMIDVINQIESKFKCCNFTAINIDNFDSFIKRFKLESIPTIIIFNNGKEIDRVVGMVMPSALKSKYSKILKELK